MKEYFGFEGWKIVRVGKKFDGAYLVFCFSTLGVSRIVDFDRFNALVDDLLGDTTPSTNHDTSQSRLILGPQHNQ